MDTYGAPTAGKGGGALGFEADWALGPGGDRREGNGPRAAQLRWLFGPGEKDQGEEEE